MIKIEIMSARNLKWANEDCTAIDCLARTNTLHQEIPFTASPNDSEVHGRELFARCLAGEFGAIAPMDAAAVQQNLLVKGLPTEYSRLRKFLDEVNLENGRKSFRSVVVLWGSYLDNLLDEIHEKNALRTLAAGERVGKPPATFGTRIKRALELGVIEQEDADRCHSIRRIRNAAAHEWELSLATENVLPSLRALYEADHSQLLVFHEDMEFLLQSVYASSCAMLAMKLIDRDQLRR